MKRALKKLTKKILLGIIAVVIISIPLLYLFLLNANKASAAWFDDNWAYRQPVTATITSSASDITNLQTLITVNTSALIGATPAKLQSSCQDLRFTSVSGKSLPYYIDSACNSTATKIWVMADLVPKNTTTYTMYMYYGNPTASAGTDSQSLDNVVGLKSYWTLNDGSGSSATDSSVKGNTGTLSIQSTGTQTTTTQAWSNGATGKYSGSLNFDGTDDLVTLPNDGGTALPSDNFTVEMWVKPSSTSGTQEFWVYGRNGGSYRVSFRRTGTSWAAYLYISDTHITGGTATVGQWSHIAYTHTSGTKRLYVDGQQVATTSVTEALFGGAGSLIHYLGRGESGGAGTYYAGQIDDVKFYSNVRTAAQIARDYNNVLPNGLTPTIASTAVGTITPVTSFGTEEKGTGPTLYWKFDDATGTTAQDSVSNNLDGTLNNTPTWQTEDQCIAGKCLWFSGTANMNVSKSDDSKLDFAASDSFTISAWVKRNSTSSANNFIITKAQSGYTGYKMYQDASGDYCFDVSDGSNTDTACTSAVDFDDNQWHLVQGVKSGTSSITLYVDGAQRAQDASIAATGTLANTGTFYAGVDLDGTSNEWLGFIDEVKVYPYARSADQVKTDYNSRGSVKGSDTNIGSNQQNNPSALSNGLVGYWKMDESSGDATDSSGNGDTLANNATATFSAGKFGNAGTLVAASSQYFSIADNSTVNIGSGDFTYTGWVKISSTMFNTPTTTGSILGQWAAGANKRFLLQYTGGVTNRFSFITTTDGNSGTSTTLTSSFISAANTWYFFTIQYNAATQTKSISINNSTPDTQVTPMFNSGTAQFNIGRQEAGSSAFFDGSIDEVRFYKRLLSSTDITSLYNFAPGPIAYYKFDDNTGSSVADSSGNASTGTWVGSNNHWIPGKIGPGGNITAGSDYVTATLSQAVDPSTTGTASFWAKDSTSNTWNYYTIAGGTSYVNGIATSFTNKYYNISSTALQIGAGNTVLAPNDSTLSSNLKLWLKADQITGKKDGETITTWSDQSGSGNNATATGGVTYHTNQQNGLPVVRFNGTNGQASVNGITSHVRNDSTFLTVLKLRSYNGVNPHSALFFSGGGGFWDPFRAHPGGTWRVFRYDGGANNTELSSTIEDTNTSIFRALTNVHSGNTTSLWQNGTIGINAGTQGGTNPTTAAIIAGQNDGGVWGNYDIAEMIVYSDDISTASRTSLETALGCKYNLSISGFTNGCLTGVIDDFKVYNYVRTPAQIIEDMDASHPAPGGVGRSSDSSPIGYWKLDEGYGTTAQDSSGNANSLTFSTISWTNSGKFNRAWNGTGALWLSRADDADFDFAATEDMAISLWFKSDSASNPSTIEYLLDKESSSAGYAIYATTSGTVCFAIDDDASWTPDVASCTADDIYDNTWHHIVGVRNTTLDKTFIYVDGVEKDSDTDTTTATLANSDSLVIGDSNASNGTDEFNGDLDEVKIYRFALTSGQVKLDMNRSATEVLGTLSDKSTPTSNQAAGQIYCPIGNTSSCASPISEWNFEENTGSTANDSSGNAHTGTWTGAAWAPGKYGSGASFTGSNSLSVATPQSYMISAATISFWVKAPPAADNNNTVFNVSAAGGAAPNALFIGDNSTTAFTNELIAFRRLNSAHTANSQIGYLTTTRTELFDNKWHHVALTFSGSFNGSKIYLDGISRAFSNDAGDEGIFQPGNGAQGANSAGIGSMKTGVVLDQLRFYNYALSPAQIQWEYTRGAPVGYWKLNECQGTIANNSSANTNTGTISPGSGGTTSVGTCAESGTTMWYNGRNGKYNSALDFDGDDDMVTVTNATAVDLNSYSGNSFSAWVYADSDGEGDLGQIYQKGTNNYLRVSSQSGSNLNIDASLDLATSDATVSITSAITTGTWNHILVSYTDDSDDEIEVYINGVLSGTSTNGSGAPAADTNNLLIGGTTTANFDGQIDEFQMFGYGLTAPQAKTLYNQGSAVRFGPTTGPLN